MNCEEARRAIGAEPARRSPELDRHVRRCPACEAFRTEMLALDERIRAALELPLRSPAAPASAALPPVTGGARHGRRHSPLGLWALAASVLAAIGAALVLWTARPAVSLAADVVTHMAGEPSSWQSRRPVDPDTLAGVLGPAAADLDAAGAEIVYARSCWFRGHYVPHLVIRTADGPVTVLLLADEPVARTAHFAEGGYTGIILPLAQGSIAVLGRGGSDVEQPAAALFRALQGRGRER